MSNIERKKTTWTMSPTMKNVNIFIVSAVRPVALIWKKVKKDKRKAGHLKCIQLFLSLLNFAFKALHINMTVHSKGLNNP